MLGRCSWQGGMDGEKGSSVQTQELLMASGPKDGGRSFSVLCLVLQSTVTCHQTGWNGSPSLGVVWVQSHDN